MSNSAAKVRQLIDNTQLFVDFWKMPELPMFTGVLTIVPREKQPAYRAGHTKLL